jgi:hypothetical protein
MILQRFRLVNARGLISHREPGDNIARKNLKDRRSLRVKPMSAWNYRSVSLVALPALIVMLLVSPEALFSVPPKPQVGIPGRIESESPASRASVKPAGKVDVPEVRYRILAHFKDVFFCDPDVFPIGLSPALARKRALDTFPEIKQDQEAFRVIVHHLGLTETRTLSDEQEFLIYGEWKKLRGAVHLERLDDQFKFNVSLKEKTGDISVQGLVNRQGSLTILKRENTFFMCPL